METNHPTEAGAIAHPQSTAPLERSNDSMLDDRAAAVCSDSTTSNPSDLLKRLAPPRTAMPLLCGLGGLLFILNLGGYPVYTKGEAREAVTILDIVHGAGVILPMRAGVEVPSKPLMMHWLAALVSLAAGQVNEWTIRLPSAVFAIFGMIACYLYVRKMFDERSGLIAAVLLGTSCQYLQAGTGGRVDMTLTFFLEVAFFEFLALAEGLRQRTFPLYLAIACAILTKGPIGLGLPLLVTALWIGLTRRTALLRSLRLGQGALIVGLIGGGWYLAAIYTGGTAFVDKQLLGENLYRLFAHHGFNEGHAHPFYYVEGALVAGFMPWTPIAALAAFLCWKRPRKIEGRFGYLLLWFLAILVFYNMPHSKRGVYLLALYPALSAIVAIILSEAIEVTPGTAKRLTRILDRSAGILFIATGISALVGCAMLYFRPSWLNWILALFGILVPELAISLRAATTDKWLATGLIAICATGAGAWMLSSRASITRMILGIAVGMSTIAVAVNLVIEPAVATTLCPREFALRTRELAASQPIYYFGSIDYAFVFYSGGEVKLVSAYETPLLVVGSEEQWPLMPVNFRARYRVLLRSNPTELDGSGRLILLRRTDTPS
jgi:4-amino-4-deoxy-L-arabinose transferase-like glycosyltransferase